MPTGDEMQALLERLLTAVERIALRVKELESGDTLDDEDEDEPQDETLLEWMVFVDDHPELEGWMEAAREIGGGTIEQPEHYAYSYKTRPTDAQIIRGLIRASAGCDEGVTSQQVLVGMYGTLDESRGNDDGLYINTCLAEVATWVGNRLFTLTRPCNGPVVQRTRKRAGNVPALWLVATDDDDDDSGCHTVVDGKRLCGVGPNGGKSKGTHSMAKCKKLGHRQCRVCVVLGGV